MHRWRTKSAKQLNDAMLPTCDMLRSDAISRALSSLYLDKLPGGATRTPCIANVSMM
jgi:hypothetical protein